MHVKEQIKNALTASVETTFESYLFAEVTECNEDEVCEDGVIVSQTFTSTGLSGRLVCELPKGLLEHSKKILMFQDAGKDWQKDFALEFVNSIAGSMMANLMDNVVYELSLPIIANRANENPTYIYCYKVSDEIIKIQVEVL